MERRIWGPSADDEMIFSVRRSSRERAWSGFEVNVYDASAGFSEVLFARHSISMHVGAPVLVDSRCDGAALERMQYQGDLKIVPAGFSRIWRTAAPSTKMVVNVSPALVAAAADELGVVAGRVHIAPQLHLNDPRIEHIAWALKAELETEEPLGRLYADSLGLALAAHLARSSTSRLGPRSVARAPSRARLRRVTEYIEAHIATDLTLAELAAVAGVSPSHFKAQFKAGFGVPVHQYVIRSRVERAVSLLLDAGAPLCDVALQAGFANQSHMALCVRRVTGTTPAVLRSAL
jgi:AraC family transcriptional regulator